MGRPPCCEKAGVKKGPWTPEEDLVLVSYVQEHGPGNWRAVPTNTGLMRCSKSCRLRWTNYLRPGIKRGNFSVKEEKLIIHLQALLGNRWAAIASYLSDRTDNDIKNYWNTHLKKKPALPSQAAYVSSAENIARLLEGWMRPGTGSAGTKASSGSRSSASAVSGGEGASASHSGTARTPEGSTGTSKAEDAGPMPAFSMLESWLLDDGMGHGDAGLMGVPLADPCEFF